MRASPSPTPTPGEFSVSIPNLYGFFETTDDVSDFTNCYQLQKEPLVDTKDANNYKIILDINYYQIVNAAVGVIWYDNWPPKLTKLKAEIQVDPSATLSDTILSVNNVDLILYSLNNGKLVIKYNPEIADVTKFVAANTNTFPKFDTTSMIQQSASAPNMDLTTNVNMCTCSVGDINYDCPGWALVPLTVGITINRRTYPDYAKAPVYTVLVNLAFLNSSTENVPIRSFTAVEYETYVIPVLVKKEVTTFSITLSKEDGKDTITYANKAVIENKPVSGFVLDACHYSMAGCDPIPPVVQVVNNAACDLCQTREKE